MESLEKVWNSLLRNPDLEKVWKLVKSFGKRRKVLEIFFFFQSSLDNQTAGSASRAVRGLQHVGLYTLLWYCCVMSCHIIACRCRSTHVYNSVLCQCCMITYICTPLEHMHVAVISVGLAAQRLLP